MKTQKTNANALKGKFYELLNIDGSVMDRIKINYVREEIRPSIRHEDGSVSPPFFYIELSDKGGGWYRYHGNGFDRIVDK